MNRTLKADSEPGPRVGRPRRWRWPLAVLLLMALQGCGSARADPPEAGEAYGGVPPLDGVRVMVMPVQRTRGVAGALDAELGFALSERGPTVRWVLPAEIREIVERSPGVDVSMDALPVGMFLRGQVRRVGDPLYGQIRRLAAMTGAQVALIPVEVRHRPETEERPAAVEISAALLNAGNGRVFWFGVVEGEPGGPRDPRALASAADALARAVAF